MPPIATTAPTVASPAGTVDAHDETAHRRLRRALGPWMQLTKARLSLLVLWTTAVGYVLGAESGGSFAFATFAITLVGTALAAGCANAANQIIEVERDAAMRRTRSRPLPSGALRRERAVAGAILLGAAGCGLLALVGALPTALAAATIVLYVAVYTPLKVRSTLNTLVGAICGALPPLIGWTATGAPMGPGAWALAAVLFVWQIPHFLALAWMYREDYARGGFVMLPAVDPEGRMTFRVVLLTSLLLIPLGVLGTLVGLAGWIHLLGTTLLGAWLLVLAAALLRSRSDRDARKVFGASIVYLAAVMMLLVLDRGPVAGRGIAPVAAATPVALAP